MHSAFFDNLETSKKLNKELCLIGVNFVDRAGYLGVVREVPKPVGAAKGGSRTADPYRSLPEYHSGGA